MWMVAALALIGAAAAVPPPPISGSGVGEATEPPEIVVTGNRIPFQMPISALRAAERTFQRARADFAPNAVLHFQLREVDGAALPGFTLQLTDGTASLPLVTDAEGRFSLPPLPRGRWRLQSSRARDEMHVRPQVRSPGAEPPSLRLGDLRLQCRVEVAMMASEASLLAQPLIGIFRAVGPCTSSRVGIYERLDQPVASAQLVEDGRTRSVALTRGAYRNPGFERGFSNDARVMIAF